MKEKRCCRCNEIKPVSDFSKDKNMICGLRSSCKKCNSIAEVKYKRTKHGLVCSIYKSQISKSKRRNHEKPKYSKAQLEEWMFNHPSFNIIYDNWVTSGYDKWCIPSIDRLDDYKGYSLKNIRLVTWKENHKKWIKDCLEGINTKTSIPVLQYDLSGNLINEYYSIRYASRETKINQQHICDVCKHKNGYNTAGGYVWEYKQVAFQLVTHT